MMRGAGGALAVAVAALLVCCSADPHQVSPIQPVNSSFQPLFTPKQRFFTTLTLMSSLL